MFPFKDPLYPFNSALHDLSEFRHRRIFFTVEVNGKRENCIGLFFSGPVSPAGVFRACTSYSLAHDPKALGVLVMTQHLHTWPQLRAYMIAERFRLLKAGLNVSVMQGYTEPHARFAYIAATLYTPYFRSQLRSDYRVKSAYISDYITYRLRRRRF